MCVSTSDAPSGALTRTASALPLERLYTGEQIVVDGGAVKSLWPRCLTDRLPEHADPRLYFTAANNSRIAAYGFIDIDVVWKDAPNAFRHRFIVADVAESLLGRDFLTMHNVVVFYGSNRLAVDVGAWTGGPR